MAERAAYDVLLHNGRTSMNGKCITEDLAGAGNRLQKAYANAGAIHMGDNEMIEIFDRYGILNNDIL